MRLPPAIREALNEAGDWSLEPRKKHVAVRLNGRVVAMLSRSGRAWGASRDWQNTLATIKRAAGRPG